MPVLSFRPHPPYGGTPEASTSSSFVGSRAFPPNARQSVGRERGARKDAGGVVHKGDLNDHQRGRSANAGLTTIELLIVMAILAVVATIGIMNYRQVLRGQEERAAIQSIQQTVWQGATAAASRGVIVNLTRAGNVFTLTETETDRVLKTFDLPPGVASNWPAEQALTFTPPGKVEAATLSALPSPLTITSSEGRVTRLTVSLIGEVRAEAYSQ